MSITSGPSVPLRIGKFVLRAVDQDRCLGCARRAEVFCDAHLKAPPIVLRKMLTNERSKFPTVATWRTHLLRCHIYRPDFPAVQQANMLKSSSS